MQASQLPTRFSLQTVYAVIVGFWLFFAVADLTLSWFHAWQNPHMNFSLPRRSAENFWVFLSICLLSIYLRQLVRRNFTDGDSEINKGLLGRVLLYVLLSALLHLAIIAITVCVFFVGRLGLDLFLKVYAEQFARWFHFELLVFGVFALFWLWYEQRLLNSVLVHKENSAHLPLESQLLLKAGKHTHCVDPIDIIWIQADDNYLHVYTMKNKITVRDTLQNLLQKLDPQIFFRSHRSAVINLTKFKQLTRVDLLMENNMTVPLSRRQRKALRARLNLDH